MNSRVTILLTLATLSPACAHEEEDAQFRMPSTTGGGTGGGPGNGTVFNTNVIDDAAVSELRQPIGTVHQGAALLSVELAGGETVEHFEVVDGDVVAHAKSGTLAAGAQLLNSTWWVLAGADNFVAHSVHLVDRVMIDGWPHYRFTEEGILGSTCLASAGGPGYARLLPGFTLDESTGQVTALADNTYVACERGATAKAASWGYYDLALVLADFEPFEAAIRVIRADYCYDGVSHTHAGVPLLIEDIWAVNTEGAEAGFDDPEIEAVWGETRLLCRGTGRVAAIPSACGEAKVPVCAPGATISTYPGARFVTRLP